MTDRRGKRIGRLLLAALFVCLPLLPGCRGTAPEAEGTPEPVEMVMARPSPTVPPIPAPPDEETDMTFDESGNVWLSDAYKARFQAKTYAFDAPPKVLIYHTHAREAFRAPDEAKTPRPAATPAASDAPRARSADQSENVVRLGALLADELTKRGFTVEHDTTDVEDPALSTAYARSLELMRAHAGVDIYIDLHRNAADVERARDDVVMLDGQRVARMFFVVGTGLKAGDVSGMLANWEDNYTFALSVGERLRALDPALCKENRVKQGAYNQFMGLCLLAEIGHNANLLSDAEAAIPYLADALAAVCVF